MNFVSFGDKLLSELEYEPAVPVACKLTFQFSPCHCLDNAEGFALSLKEGTALSTLCLCDLLAGPPHLTWKLTLDNGEDK